MFKLSTRVQYGLEVMEALATKPDFVSLTDLSEEIHRSANYLQQIIKPLKEAGLVISKEGVTGGIKLAKSPKAITLYDVLVALDGEVQPISCLSDDHACPTKQTCGHRKYWSKVTDILEEQFKNTTLIDLK